MGRGVIDAGLFRAERYKLEQRTSDPTDPAANEEWLRVDIKPTYEDADGNTQTGVAEYRRANADGTVDTAPVAVLGHSTDSNVIDKVRAHVDAGGSPTGTGFVPYASSGATYANRKLEHPTDGRVAMHDALTASAIPDSGVFRLTFDDADTSGSTALDVWNDYDGAINGATTGAAGLADYDSGESYSFDGVDDLVNLGDLPEFDEVSIGVWVYPTAKSDFARIIENGVSTSVFSLSFDGSSDQKVEAEVRTGGSTTTITGSAIPTNSKTHLILSYNGSTLKLFENGSLSNDAAASGSIDTTSEDAAIGARADGALHFEGRQDDPRYYSKGVTDTEASNWYSTGSISG